MKIANLMIKFNNTKIKSRKKNFEPLVTNEVYIDEAFGN